MFSDMKTDANNALVAEEKEGALPLSPYLARLIFPWPCFLDVPTIRGLGTGYATNREKNASKKNPPYLLKFGQLLMKFP